MKSLRVVLVLALFAGALACAGTHKAPHFSWDQKADFAAMKTFAWYGDRSFRLPHAESIVDGRFLDEHIRAAIASHLEKMGYREATGAAADMYVAYHTGQDGVASQDEYGVYDWWWFPLYVYEGSDYEKERSIVVDIRGARKKLAWRGMVTRLEGTNPDAVGREIDRAVGELLTRFPPPPGAVPPAKP